MHVQVLVKISFLCEGLVAAQVAALERSFAGVDAKMVKKVVPLAEIKLASSEVTLQNFDTSVGSRVLVFKYAVTSGQRNLNFFDPDLVHVQGGAVLHMNWGVWWYLLTKLVVLDLVTEAGVGGNLAVDTLFIDIIFVLL